MRSSSSSPKPRSARPCRRSRGEPSGSPTRAGLGTELDREGFVLVDHVSAVEDFDLIQVDPAVDQRYVDEITDLLARTTGASRARSCSAAARSATARAPTDKLAPLSNAKPARYPHADNTDTSAQGLVDMIAAFVPDLDLARYSRWALYNLWRATTPPPQDFPLAVCDARTLAPGDEVTVKAITEELRRVRSVTTRRGTCTTRPIVGTTSAT